MNRQRSTAYPILSLSLAYQILRENLSTVGVTALNRDQLAKRLGYQTAYGGLAARKVGGLVHYGLLERQGGYYNLSPLGRRLQELEPQDKEFLPAIQAAFESPALFRSLTAKFQEIGRLPDDLSVELASLGIQEGACADAEAVFRKSALFAHVIHPDGRFYRLREGEVSDGSEDRSKPREDWEDLPLMLSDKKHAYLRIPRSMKTQDIKLLRHILEATLNNLPAYLGLENTSGQAPVRAFPREA